MASPSNASEPESPEEEEILVTGFDPLLFWDQYRQIILIAGGVILLVVVGFGIYEYNQSQLIAAAGAALAQSASEDDYRQLIAKYPGTMAAGDASLILASKLCSDKKYDDALQILQAFIDKYPTHPLISGGELSVGETLEAQGKLDDALAKYQEVAAKYPDTYAAPLAMLAQANLLKFQGKIEDSRHAYENFVAQFPDSIFSQQAQGEMHMLRPETGATPAVAPPREGQSAASLLNLAPAPAPSATPPIVPAIPGAQRH